MLHKKLVTPRILAIAPSPEGGPLFFPHYCSRPCTLHPSCEEEAVYLQAFFLRFLDTHHED